MHFEYGLDPSLTGAGAAVVYDQRTAEQAVGSDSTEHTITTTVTGLVPNATYHVRAVASSSAGSVTGADQVFKTRADPLPPPPVLGQKVNVTLTAGQVFIELPPGATISQAGGAAPLTKGSGFIPLTEARQIPVGSILDTTRGTVGITAATSSKSTRYTGNFTSGVFALLQNRSLKGLTELDLMDTLSRTRVCASVGKGAKASIAKTVSSKVLGLLKSTDHGKFTTRGTYSAATTRGTQYSVADTCAGTLTSVTRGAVVVDYVRRHQRLLVRAGHSFLALASGAPSKVVTIGKGAP